MALSGEATIQHAVRQYDAQRDGTALVSGWEVYAQVTGVTGRRFRPVVVAVCPDEEDANNIAALLNTQETA